MRRLLLLTLLALGGDAAHAENGFFYLGAGVSHNTVSDILDLGNQADISGASWKAFAGVRPIGLFGVEGDYLDLGSGNSCASATCSSTAHSDGKAFVGYLVGFAPIPLPIVDFFGKVGAAHWKLNGNVSVISLSVFLNL